MNRIHFSHSAPTSHLQTATLFSPAFLMMQQSLSVLFFATLIILLITLATPFQKFSANSHSTDIHNEYPPNDLKSSYDGGDAAIESGTSEPVIVADDPGIEWLHGNFLVPSPPSWQGIDNNIAPQFTCDKSDPYCCTGRYIRRKGWVLGPCDPCPYHFPVSQLKY